MLSLKLPMPSDDPHSPDPALSPLLDAQLDEAARCAAAPAAITPIDALPVAAYIIDKTGLITSYNEAAAELWGRRPLIGQDRWCGSWRSLAPDGSLLPHERGPLAETLKTGRPVRGMEAVAERPDGTRVPFQAFPALLRDAEGRPAGAINILVDLTQRTLAEADLRASEEHYRHAVELNPQMPWTADRDGRILHFNDHWCRFVGQSREEALESGWTSVGNPDDMPGVRAAVRDALSGSTPLDARFRVRTAGGEERWVRARAYPRLDQAGQVVRWYGSTEDIHDAVMAEEELRAAEQRFRLIARASDDVVWDHDLDRDRVTWTEGLERRFGAPACSAASPTWWVDHIHPDDRDRVDESYRRATGGHGSARWFEEYRFRREDGRYAHVLDRGALIRDAASRPVRMIGAMLDQSERKRAEQALRLSEERLRLAAAVAGLGIADCDPATGVDHWSDALRAMLGVTADMPANMATYLGLLHPDERSGALEHQRRAADGDFAHQFRSVRRIVRPSDGATRWIATEGHELRNDEGEVARIIITARDVTEEKTTQDRINWAATHDALTGLPNRPAYRAALEEILLATAASPGGTFSVLLFDLDNFKQINDTLGHLAGDEVLADFARRIADAMPAGATVARFGGDEFAAILPATDGAAAAALGRDIVQELRRPVVIGNRAVDSRASIGVASYPLHGRDASALLQAADIALYAAKDAGRSTVRLFEPVLRAHLQQQMSMLRQARTVLDRGWILPHYQPKVRLDGGRTDGFEALLRWAHPRAGLQLPGTIAGALDDPELAGQLGAAMIQAVLADMRGWLSRGIAFGRVAINASPAEFQQAGYGERLLARMAACEVPPAMLELEITETALFGSNAGSVVTELETLRAAGVSVALDDFGTGCSSLSQLRRLPVDTIKIDRSFISGILDSPGDRAIVEALLRLAPALGLGAVAEGVESAAQAGWLRNQGCPLAQGFHFAPALAADQAIALVPR